MERAGPIFDGVDIDCAVGVVGSMVPKSIPSEKNLGNPPVLNVIGKRLTCFLLAINLPLPPLKKSRESPSFECDWQAIDLFSSRHQLAPATSTAIRVRTAFH